MTHTEAKKWLKRYVKETDFPMEQYEKALLVAITAIHDAKWQEHENGHWNYAQCSECKTIHDTRSNYCPFCGARMDGYFAGLTKLRGE